MKLNFDISSDEYKIINNILNKYLKDTKVYVFGSRAKNRSRFNSDIDIALEADKKIDKDILIDLKEDFDDCDLKFSVDIVDLNNIDDGFKKIIDSEKVEFPLKRNIPKLRFKEFSSKNDVYKFEDIFSFSTGKNIKQNEASPDFEIPCVRYGELYHMYGEVISKVVNKTNLDKSELLFSEGNEILMPSAGEDPLDIGSASALTIKDVAIGRTINILRPLKENVYSQKYVSYYINEKLRKKISTLAKGSSISNVYNSDLKKLNIPLPMLEEQEKIASFLTSVDTKIEQLTKKKFLLKKYKKSVMQKIFNQEIRFVNDDGSEFCEWEEKTIKDISVKKSSNISANTLENNSGEYKIYGASGYLKNIDFFTENEPYISIVKDGAGVGRVLLCEKNSSVLGTLDILINKENINLHFVYLLLTRIHFEKYIVGSTIPHIYYKDYSSEKINLPCIEEQTKIANFLSSIDTKLEQTQKQLKQTKKFKKALLQTMFV